MARPLEGESRRWQQRLQILKLKEEIEKLHLSTRRTDGGGAQRVQESSASVPQVTRSSRAHLNKKYSFTYRDLALLVKQDSLKRGADYSHRKRLREDLSRSSSSNVEQDTDTGPGHKARR